jgi:hypothetical protein
VGSAVVPANNLTPNLRAMVYRNNGEQKGLDAKEIQEERPDHFSFLCKNEILKVLPDGAEFIRDVPLLRRWSAQLIKQENFVGKTPKASKAPEPSKAPSAT